MQGCQGQPCAVAQDANEERCEYRARRGALRVSARRLSLADSPGGLIATARRAFDP